MSQFEELQKRYSVKRTEMEQATRQLHSHATQLTGTVERVRNIVAGLQEVCEQLDALEFVTETESKTKEGEEGQSSVIDSRIRLCSDDSGAPDSSDSSCVLELEPCGVDPGSDQVSTESSTNRSGGRIEDFKESCKKTSSSLMSNLCGKLFFNSDEDSPILPTQDYFPKPRHSTPSKKSGSSLLEIKKTPETRKEVTKRTRVDTPRPLSHKNDKGMSLGNVLRQEEKLPGRKYGRRQTDDAEITSWLPVASLNIIDVPVGSKIRFQYEIRGQLITVKGKVASVDQSVMTVQVKPHEQGISRFWKKLMKDVMIQSTAQAAKCDDLTSK
ncbi:unnamed protein product [Allacma fusca]|uniref:Uncharacterized protein n=1 Tax=Allacma fusca TaxID=39272 RepID=A0A8J2P9W4_9HEXA|nr:unnamed protein product [Allacma fusca]